MNKKIYSVYDRAAGRFGNPFICLNDEMAQREFNCAFSAPEYQYLAKDLDLYYLGTFDDRTGEMVLENKPVFLGGVSNG